ncbi:hypothetical protein AUEXF2481DRAFT_89982 [Aureobasidium subglaciale EXF-2481]|uniref:Uncharacterized protein n=1 Tax=Aureobasidium subglaciale (strain EXF-2481) TaxID=1043005 RepID=A0A074Y8Z1_AURSE|nr:uncharacterized protein AUEXF2481DRAFT_89982 [Aureobasidium subglaciale EXF-2481]KEQ94205.1 hypothetical protein AUEXF2481DRAFT_89982 [Aureobasidium subglaciale EXF-2481]
MSQRLYATPPRGQSVSVNSALRRPAQQICQALVAADNLAESTFAITRGAVLLASFTSTNPRVHQIYIAWTNPSLGQHAIATVELTSHTSARPKLCSSTTPCPDPALGSLNFIVSTTGLDEFWLTMLFFVHLHSIYQAALAERMSDNFRGWLDWTSGNTSSPPVDQGQQDEAVRIFEAINENEPAWDITTHSSLPAWVTTDDLRRVWFSNTDYFLPFYGSLYPDYRDVILDTSTIEFLELLRRMVKPRPITVDVLVHEEGIFNRISLHRLLLVSYHLGGRSDLLNIRVIASTGSGRLDTNAKIADPLKVRLLQDCATMQKFRDGTMSLEQVFDEYEVPLTRSDIQALSPENAVARLLTGQTISAGIYSDFGLSNQSTAQLKQYCTELKAEANSRAEEEDDEEEDSDEASDEDKEFSGLNGKTTRQ